MKPILHHLSSSRQPTGPSTRWRPVLPRVTPPALLPYLWLALAPPCPARAAGWSPAPAAFSLPLLTLPTLLAGTGTALVLAAICLLWMLHHQQGLRRAQARLMTQLATETTSRINAQLAVLTTHATLSKLVARQAVIKSGERRRIARDIHDDLGQNLLALKIDLSLLQMSTTASHPALHQQLVRVAQHVELTIRSMRSVVLDLQPIALDAGLRIGLERLFHEFSRSHGISYRLHAGPGVYDHSAGIDTLLFRCTQEALANIARHAKASVVSLTLLRDATGLTMTVCDNGVGIPSGQAGRGCGLLGMQQRVAAAGGGFSVVSRPGAGTVLSLSIPLPATPPHGAGPGESATPQRSLDGSAGRHWVAQ